MSLLASDGIPLTALSAFTSAAHRLAVTAPGCGLTWPLLAAIGRVESNDGRFGGAQLLTTGYSTVKILGPLLDGHGDAVVKAVRVVSSSAASGVTAGYARAMGPMQFIPSTWAEYASDGNGDGIESPFNIFDASLAAARYLCVAGGNLRTPAGQRRAVFAYNHVPSYVVEVLSLEKTYQAGARIVGGGGAANSTGQGAAGKHRTQMPGTRGRRHGASTSAPSAPGHTAVPVASPTPSRPPVPVTAPSPVTPSAPVTSSTPVTSAASPGHGSPTR